MIPSFTNQRILCWFSCGAASAVATKTTLQQYGSTNEVLPIYCNTMPSEHPDNQRFFEECERWFGQRINILSSSDFANIDDVFVKTRYMSGVRGARCTTEMKKIPRLRFALPDDIHVFGFTSDEVRRIADFEQRNPDMRLFWTLRDAGITKQACLQALTAAGINLPMMYQLGFENNNCLGCVKATSAWYWDRVRTLFPDVFKRRCEQSRELGVRLTRLHGQRIFLDELPPGPYKKPHKKENLSCGPECGGPALVV